MALSKSGKLRPKRQAVAMVYAERLKGAPSYPIERKHLRYFNSRWPLIRKEMQQRLIERITDALGQEWLNGRRVNVTMEYESSLTPKARKLLSGVVSLTNTTL